MHTNALHHVSFAVTDLARTEQFARDFGLLSVSNNGATLFMRTDGGDAWCYQATQAETAGFLSMGFAVESDADLEEAIHEHGASAIRELDAPGGGRAVTMISPDGMKVDLVCGVESNDPRQPDGLLKINSPGARTRFADPQEQRALAPPALFRLGHVGLFVKDYAATSAWLKNTLGLRCSDAMYAGSPDRVVAGFFRLDSGEGWVDHHTIFMAQRETAGIHHVSFEVQDYETQFRAHRWLRQQGWTPSYGVGRHPLGSHIFDMWRDPDGFRFETFSDTDLVNHHHKAGHHNIAEQEIDMWGSADPAQYFV